MKTDNGKPTKVQQLDFYRVLDHLLENCKNFTVLVNFCKSLLGAIHQDSGHKFFNYILEPLSAHGGNFLNP